LTPIIAKIGAAESLVANDTYQFEDYSKIVATRFDPVKKSRDTGETISQ